MKKISAVVTVLVFLTNPGFAEEKKETQSLPDKPTGKMVDCDRRVNRAAIKKVLAELPLKNYGTNFSLKSKLYYPVEFDDESFDVGIVADGQEFDVTVKMDEKCKKVVEVKIDK